MHALHSEIGRTNTTSGKWTYKKTKQFMIVSVWFKLVAVSKLYRLKCWIKKGLRNDPVAPHNFIQYFALLFVLAARVQQSANSIRCRRRSRSRRLASVVEVTRAGRPPCQNSVIKEFRRNSWCVVTGASPRETPPSLRVHPREAADRESSGRQLSESGRQTYSATDSWPSESYREAASMHSTTHWEAPGESNEAETEPFHQRMRRLSLPCPLGLTRKCSRYVPKVLGQHHTRTLWFIVEDWRKFPKAEDPELWAGLCALALVDLFFFGWGVGLSCRYSHPVASNRLDS